MDPITAEQESIYREIWDQPEYRAKCHGIDLWRDHRDAFPSWFHSALDIGCGLGLLMGELNESGYDAWGYDIAHNCLDEAVQQLWGHKFIQGCLWEMDLHERFDVGVCADVMEHIPTKYVAEVLRRIARHCSVILFIIAYHPYELIGYPLHLTMRHVDWWVKKFETVGPKPEVLPYSTGRTAFYMRWQP